jgi:lysophospholipase L1-like esterase
MLINHSDLLSAGVQFSGALDFDQRPAGLSPRRLPGWTRSQVPEVMDVIVRMPSGVRLSLTTDSAFIELEVQSTRMFTPPATPRSVSFDLMIDHQEVRHLAMDAGNSIKLNPARPGEFELIRGQAYGVRFDELPVGEHHYELWLPHNAFVEIRSVRLAANSLVRAVTDDRPRWLHYGSSISHCMEADSPTGTWPAVAAYAGQQQVNLQSFGFAGQCHLDQFVARAMRELPAELITLKVGINLVNGDTMRERVFPSALHGFLDTLREGQPQTPIIVISPIYCPSAEDHPGPTLADANGQFRTHSGDTKLRQGALSLKRIRTLMSELVMTRRQAGDTQLHYLDGLVLFGQADAADLPDLLHPNPAGYRRMGERFASRVFNGHYF